MTVTPPPNTSSVDPSWPADRAAAGDLEDLRRLLNTANLETGEDMLADLPGFRSWLSATDRQPFAPTRSILDRLRRLREDTRLLLAADRSERAAAAAIWAEAASDLTLRVDPGLGLRPAHDGGQGLVEHFAAAIVSAHLDGSLERLKVCRNPGCRWSFYDHSRGKTGAWCSMKVCGSRTKMRAYRARSSGREGNAT